MRLFVVAIFAAIVAPALAAIQKVEMKSLRFNPQVLNINPGDEVVWTNNDLVDHTVTADIISLFDSGDIPPGQSFSHTFSTAATVNYRCAYHAFMLGNLTVTNKPSSGNTLHAPVQVVLAIGGSVAVLAQFL